MTAIEQGLVGGHLFAIAADKSIEWGYEGDIHGFAANEELSRYAKRCGKKLVELTQEEVKKFSI